MSDAANIEAGHVEAARVEAAQVETAHIETARVEAGYVELARRLIVNLVGTPEVADTDNLFNVGGDSLTAIRLAWRLSKETGIEVNVIEDIMADPTPRAIAGKLLERATGIAVR